MAADSSRPGTSNESSSVTTTSTTGIRGIRANKSTASESWDDDFLWQHSSSSDLHLPSTASRHRNRQLSHRDKRLSTASSSSEYYAPRAPLRPYRKASTLSNSTMGSITPDEASSSPVTSVGARNALSRSESSSHSHTSSSSHQRHTKHWANLSQTSLAEEGEDEPTITLATIASRQTALVSVPMSRTSTSHSSTSPLRSPYTSSSNDHQHKLESTGLFPPSPSFFRTVSTSSWRSTTPSLASDTWSTGAGHTDDNATSATETDNETAAEEEGQVEHTRNNELNTDDTWEQLNLSPEGMLLANGQGRAYGHTQGGGSSSRRKRGRGNTLGTSTPRMALSALFGNAPSAKDKEAGDVGTPSKRPGLFRRSSRMKTVEKAQHPTAAPVSDIASPHALGIQPEESKSHSPVPLLVSGQQTPTLPHRELPTQKREDKTVRARQSTGASSATSNPLFFSSPAKAQNELLRVSPSHSTTSLGRQASFERTPKGSNDTNARNDRSKALSRISYNSILSDRLRFQEDDPVPGPSADASRDATQPLHASTWPISDTDDADFDRSQEGLSLARQSHFLSAPTAQEQHLGSSTTSLVSNQSSATYTSLFSNDSQAPQLGRKESMPRRKLKKTRPQTPSSPIVRQSSMLFRPRTAEGPPSTSHAGAKSPVQSGPTLSPGFAFPRTIHSFTPAATASSPRGTKSPAGSVAGEVGGGNTSETASASSSRKNNGKNQKNLGIASSLGRRISKRKTQTGVAEESSADESEFLNTRRGSLDKASTAGPTPKRTLAERPIHPNSSVETWKAGRTANPLRLAQQETTAPPKQQAVQPVDKASVRPLMADPDLPATMSGSMRGTRLLAGLSKRMSIDFKSNKAIQQAPEKKRSVIFARNERPESMFPPRSEVTSTSETRESSFGAVEALSQNAPPTVVKKHKRPLSLSGFLSRSTGPFEASRARASSTVSTQEGLSLSTDGVLGRSVPPAPASASVLGGFRRPSGFMHRSTASSGNIPTAKVLLEGTTSQTTSHGIFGDRRPSLDGSIRSPPVLHRQRSFNPLWRSMTATVPEERPPSSLSLLSETSTVRPMSMLPTASSTATITARQRPESMVASLAIKMEGPPTKLRQRHLPSLSLTLLPGPTTSTPPKSSTASSFPSLSPRMMQRAYSENPYGTAHSSLRSHYFTAANSSKSSTLASTPGAGSRGSDDSDGSVNLVRRVSLSDLKIPQRISNAQAKIGQDLKRVKEFKEGVEELKRLRKVYRGLVNSVSPTLLSATLSNASPSTSLDARAEASPSPPSLPLDTTARMDNLMARVALDYSRWWEIADVLINLADGAEEDEKEPGSENGIRRERCKSEQTVGTGSPPRQCQDLLAELHVSQSQASNNLDSEGTHTSAKGSGPQIPTGDSAPSSTKQVARVLASPKMLSTPVQHRKLPQLSRSFSTSSLSPPSAQAARSLHREEGLSYSTCSNGRSTMTTCEDQSLSLSERQLSILRGMLKPPSTPTMSPSSRSVDSSPARTPSITSLSPRSHLFLNGLIPLTPFKPATGASASSSITSLKRRTSMKSGHIIITSLPSSTRTEQIRAASPIPDSPPFHISNMLPSPEHTMHSTPTNSTASLEHRPTTSRSISGQTDTTKSSSINSGASISKSSPSTPAVRKGRLRQASRAGMLGIRDFLKTFNARRNTLEGSTTVQAVDSEMDSSQQHEEADSTDHVAEPETVDTREHSPRQIRARPLPQEASSLTHCKNGSNSSSEEEEDWDRHSSEEEEASQHLPRSDTQATVMPAAHHVQAKATHTSSGLGGTGIPDTAEACTPLRQAKKSSNQKSLLRHRTLSTKSNATSSTVVQYASVLDTARDRGRLVAPRPKTSHAEQHQPRTSPAAFQGTQRTITEDCNIRMTETKLAMTSEAMPILLAKIMEVKEHCATCVTELRNVTV